MSIGINVAEVDFRSLVVFLSPDDTAVVVVALDGAGVVSCRCSAPWWVVLAFVLLGMTRLSRFFGMRYGCGCCGETLHGSFCWRCNGGLTRSSSGGG